MSINIEEFAKREQEFIRNKHLNNILEKHSEENEISRREAIEYDEQRNLVDETNMEIFRNQQADDLEIFRNQQAENRKKEALEKIAERLLVSERQAREIEEAKAQCEMITVSIVEPISKHSREVSNASLVDRLPECVSPFIKKSGKTIKKEIDRETISSAIPDEHLLSGGGACISSPRSSPRVKAKISRVTSTPRVSFKKEKNSASVMVLPSQEVEIPVEAKTPRLKKHRLPLNEVFHEGDMIIHVRSKQHAIFTNNVFRVTDGGEEKIFDSLNQLYSYHQIKIGRRPRGNARTLKYEMIRVNGDFVDAIQLDELFKSP